MEKMEWAPPKVRTAVSALLTQPGTLSPELRQSIEAYAAGKSGSHRGNVEIPEALVSYVDKVTHYAYRVIDEDVEELKAAGYSEDAIFEITMCASVGASLGRMESGLQALKGGLE